VRSLIGELVHAADRTVVADMEAGLEHLSRGTPRHADAIVAVVEPYFKSLETGRRVYELAQEFGVAETTVVANKIRSPEEDDAVRAFCARHGLRLLGVIPFDEVFVAADREGRAPLDLDAGAAGIAAIVRLAERLEGLSRNRSAHA
jgi:CO dehydrogenase maturation factor